MKKRNNTYINNLFNKILNESLEERADDIVNTINGDNIDELMNTPIEEGSETCEGCGTEISEGSNGLCEQCGSKTNEEVYEEFNEEYDEGRCKYHMKAFGPDNERTIRFCKRNDEEGGDLIGVDSDIDTERMEEMVENEVEEGNEFSMKLSQARKDGEKTFKVGGKTYPVKESKKTKLKLTESELIELIEKIVKEEKVTSNIKKGKSAGQNEYNTIHKESGKENEDYIKLVTKKMEDYLKNGSKGDYTMDPKMFPQGNGEIAKMDKAAYVPSEDVRDYIEAFTGAGMENLDYDEIKPNEEWIEKNIVGSSETGNNPDWANAVETPVNKRRNKIRKDNLLAKAKRKAYNKADQPVVQDKTGDGEVDKILTKLESTKNKPNKLNEQFDKIKGLISYDRKTQ